MLFYSLKRFNMAAVFVLLSALILTPLVSSAQAPATTSVQEQCFMTLKENLKEAALFEAPLAAFENASYSDIEESFSTKHPTLQSFYIGVDKPIISTRIASFGEQTGYVHPPKSLFPDYLKSTPWEAPAKQYVIGEEYVTDESGVEHFVDCFFLEIDSFDLMAVTEDRYAYDGAGISLIKTSADGSYKAAFQESPSFDYEDKPLATWRRMFVYPQAANNPYFNKYQVIDAFPANAVASFSVLEFFTGEPLTKIEDFDIATQSTVYKYFRTNQEGDVPEELVINPALQPVVLTGIDTVFPRSKYYQSIDSLFPDFSDNLSVFGSVKYKSFIDIITNPNLDPEVGKFMVAFSNGEALKTYYFGRNADGSNANPEFDRVIPLIQNGDWTLAQLKAGAKFDELVFQPEVVEVEEVVVTVPESSTQKTLVSVIVLLALFAITGIALRQRRKHLEVLDNVN